MKLYELRFFQKNVQKHISSLPFKNINTYASRVFIYGIDINKDALSSAYELGLIENIDQNIPGDLDDLLVIFSVPVLSIKEAMSTINTMISIENVTYTDTLSVKSSVLNTLQALDKNVLKSFVLSHPIAGSEHSGFKSSSADLFKEKLKKERLIKEILTNSDGQIEEKLLSVKVAKKVDNPRFKNAFMKLFNKK